MMHRALFGSIERFFGVLLEHYAGAFPTWLAPVQVRVLPVATATRPTPPTVADRLQRRRLPGRRRSTPTDQLGKRIRAAKLEKLPVRARGRRRRRRRRHRRRQPAGRRGRARRRRRRVRRPASPADVARRRPLQPRRRERRRCSSGSGPAGGRRTSPRVGRLADDGRRRAVRVHAHPASRACPTRRPTSSTAARTCFAILNAFPYTTATCWCCRTARWPTLEDLSPDEHAELWATVTDAVRGAQGGLPARRA